MQRKERFGREFLYIFGLMLILGLEVFLFNFRYWLSRDYRPVEIPMEQLACSGLYGITDEGEYIFWTEEKAPGTVCFSVEDLNAPVYSIAVLLRSDYSETKVHLMTSSVSIPIRTNIVRLSVSGHDPQDGWCKLAEGYTGRDSDKYDVFSFSGRKDADKIELSFEPLYGADNLPTVLSGIKLNEPVPFFFSVFRVALLYAGYVLIMVLRPGSKLWQTPLLGNDGRMDKRMKPGLIAGIVFCSLVFFVLVKMNIIYSTDQEMRPFYTDLAHALEQGSFALDIEADPLLETLANPYDIGERDDAGAFWLLDYAYYKGNYYCYFGIVPCLLFYLPALILFGTDVLSWKVLCLLCVGFLAGVSLLLTELFRRYRAEASCALYVITWILLVSCISLPAIAVNSTTYYVPIFSGVVFFVYGLLFYLSFLRYTEKTQDGEEDEKGCAFLFLGSLCMALIAGCRPQLVLAAAVALPLFVPPLLKRLRQKDRPVPVRRCLCFALPYLFVAIALMYYNYSRFGSCLQFGAIYNLTIDPAREGFSLENTMAGLRYYLFRYGGWSDRFPYTDYDSFSWDNPFHMANKPAGNGLFLEYPFLLLSLSAFFIKGKNDKQRESIWLVRVLVVMGGIFTLIASNMVGLIARYRLDFAFFFGLAAILMILNFRMSAMARGKSVAKWAVSFLVLFCAVSSILTYFAPGELGDNREISQRFYADIVHTVEFWR